MVTNTIQYPIYELRSKLLVLLFEISKPLYKKTFKLFKKSWKKTKADLMLMEANSLGKDLYLFLEEHEFEIEDKIESHDVCHVLFQFPTDVANEVAMQFFLLGSGKRSFYTYFTIFIGFFILPESHSLFHQAFQDGKQALNIQKWDFEHLLKENTSTLRALIFKENSTTILYI